MAHLADHPEDANLSARKLGELLGVNRQTVNEVLQEFRKRGE